MSRTRPATASCVRTVLGLLLLPVLAASNCESITIHLSFVTPKKAESTETRNVAMPAGAKLVVNHKIGSTRVTVDPTLTEAAIEMIKTAVADSQEAADALLAEIVVNIVEPTAEDNALRVSVERPAGATGDNASFEATLVDDELNIVGIVNSRTVAVVALRFKIPAGHPVEVNNANGPIRAVSLDASGELNTENGSVRLIGAQAGVVIRSGNGSATVEGHRGSLDARCENGSMDVTIFAVAADQAVELASENGSIELRLPQDVDAELDASTRNGSVQFSERNFDSVSNLQRRRGSVQATLNDGGPAVNVRSENGSVAVRSL